jgi:3-phenylpropionate/trans-cinnamate dioxygenase ferredoxin reductase component
MMNRLRAADSSRKTEVDVLLVGGGVASARCARVLRRSGFDGSILIATDEPRAPYNRPPLSKEALRNDVADGLLGAETDAWYERHRVGLLTNSSATVLDAANRAVTFADGGRVGFGRALLATGAMPRLPSLPGAGHARTLRTLDDARALRAAATRGGRAVIIGGGFIGVEVAWSLTALGMRVTVIERSAALWSGRLGGELSRWARDRLEAAGVQILTDSSVSEIEPGCVWAEGEAYEGSLILAAIGVVPRDGLAASAGLTVDDGIVTDAEQRTSHPAVWAAGDAARTFGRRVEHWHAAREAGDRAGRSMLGLEVVPPRAPWIFTEVCGISLEVMGAASSWDEERWLSDGLLVYLDAGRTVQLAVIDSALPPEHARTLVEEGASVAAVQAAAASRSVG